MEDVLPMLRRSGVFALSCAALLVSACGSETASPPTGPSADAVLFGRLFDAGAGTVIERGVVVIAGERVRCAGERDACSWRDADARHDYGDALLLPGLIDLHVHARPHYIGAFVPAGVTTVRDAGNTLDNIAQMRAMPGAPRIFAAGPLIDGPDSVMTPDGPRPLDVETLGAQPSLTVASAAEADAAIAALAEHGVDWIKLYEQLPPVVFDAAVAAAARHGLPVMSDLGLVVTRGLSGADVDARQAAAAGVTTLEHIGGAALSYARLGGDPMADTLDDAHLDRIVADLAASGVAVVPTAGNTAQFFSPDSLERDGLPGAGRIAPHFEGYWSHLAGVLASPAAHARARADQRLLDALLPRLHAAGVPIGAGSDVPAAPYIVPGPALHQELEALVRAGLSPVQALQSATVVAASILGQSQLGRLDAGALADVLVVDGDPLADIRATRNVVAVWKDGAAVDLAAAWPVVEAALEAARVEAEAAGG
ncbi:hypothetical protein E2F49_00665 [Luteimonas terrae]|uniref:Amidohydrolase-related domain-containing protein n=2 Tax=Luteimonas terrae TaxID=1530191 RepID=A0A4R5UBM9_9GAMM|nr:hypothetical protein E2F49_00665 [Luteimonas terrae]